MMIPITAAPAGNDKGDDEPDELDDNFAPIAASQVVRKVHAFSQ